MSLRRMAILGALVAAASLSPPVGWLAVAVHEAGHAAAAWATGGEVLDVVVGEDLHGATTYTGGWPEAVALAGPLVAGLAPAALAAVAARAAVGRWPGLVALAVALRAALDVAAHAVLWPGADVQLLGAALDLPPRLVGLPLAAAAWGAALGALWAYRPPMLQVSDSGPKPAA